MAKRAEKSLKALDTQAKKRIELFLDQLESSFNPRLTGKPLQGSLKAAIPALQP